MLLVVSCLLPNARCIETPQEFDLGGTRKATTSISESGDNYRVSVRFIPVKVFDETMNRRLSNETGRFYAQDGMLRFLDAKHATFRKLVMLESESVDGRLGMIFSIPKDCVNLEMPIDNHTKQKPRETIIRSPIAAKKESGGTLAFIAEANRNDQPSFKEELEQFYEQIIDVEEVAVNRLASLANESKMTDGS
jgi:hypothetical protein